MSKGSRKHPEAAGGDVHIHEDYDRSFEDKRSQGEDGGENFRRVSARSSARRGSMTPQARLPRTGVQESQMWPVAE